MRISRRDLLLGSASALSAATLPFPKPAIAQSEPIKIGCLAAITGPSSAPTIGFNRGVNFAAARVREEARASHDFNLPTRAACEGGQRRHAIGERTQANAGERKVTQADATDAAALARVPGATTARWRPRAP